ncbi:MAG: molybdopterin-synthase adenylyltransferase MoeB [Elusimicrobia bacterium]|nr:molybdopterin-synthase adenylyltransferase MoeB [Candidatus Obscuribacterium magneticum]
MTLTGEEIIRYSRQIILPDVGKEGQEKLKNAKILLIGTGGLGSPNAMYLAASGVGTLGLVDFDVVDPSNLHRQLLFGSDDVGKVKVEAAQSRIKSINPNVEVRIYNEKLSRKNALPIFKDYDVIIDGSDNFPTRYLTNDACIMLNKPNIYGSVYRFEGQASVFLHKVGPCYRCLFPEPPPPQDVPSCVEGGVLGILPGLIGLIQASETIKYLLGKGNLLVGRLLQVNVMDMTFRELKIQRDRNCPVCGDKPTITKLADYEGYCGVGLGQEDLEEKTGAVPEMTPAELKKILDRGDKNIKIIDVREPDEHEFSRLPGSIPIPLGDIIDRSNELDPNQEYVLHCRTGKRSAKAIRQLQRLGFKRLKNLKGGINAFADIDRSIPKY